MNIRKNKGITLVALTITIIILLIISGISISGTIRGVKETDDSTKISELTIVQHAVLERYTKSKYTKETLPGTEVDISEVQKIVNEINSNSTDNITLKGTEYKRLSIEDLENLGITDEEDSYIVNYNTGEVMNESTKVTESGRALYIYSKVEN